MTSPLDELRAMRASFEADRVSLNAFVRGMGDRLMGHYVACVDRRIAAAEGRATAASYTDAEHDRAAKRVDADLRGLHIAGN